MALNAAIVLEVRNGGSDTNGGGFKTGATGTDWTLQDAAQYSVTDGVTAGTTTITSATAAFGTDVVGNLIFVSGGTGSVTAAWYEIVTRTNSTTIVVDRSTGLTAGTGVTLKIGGALASPGQAGAIATVAGHTVFIKYNAAAYVATSASTNIAAGCVSGIAGTAYCGYDTTRSVYNLDANRPTFQLSVGTATLFTNANVNYLVSSIILDANSQATSRCAQLSGTFFYVKAMNATVAGLADNTVAGTAILCEVTGCTALPLAITSGYFCIAHDNTLGATTGAITNNGGSISHYYGCISYSNSRSGFLATGVMRLVNCVAYANTEVGFMTQNQTFCVYANCIAEGNTGVGFSANTGSFSLINCASFNNSARSSAGTGKIWSDLNSVAGSGSFFVDATNKDFRLNNTGGAGAAARAVGFPTAFPSPANLTTNYHDLGAVQHQDAGGGGGMLFTPDMAGT